MLLCHPPPATVLNANIRNFSLNRAAILVFHKYFTSKIEQHSMKCVKAAREESSQKQL